VTTWPPALPADLKALAKDPNGRGGVLDDDREGQLLEKNDTK